MKQILKAILLLVLCSLLLLTAVACSGGIKGEDAKATVADFLAAIAAEDYAAAESLLHPERPAALEPFFLSVEEDEGLDFAQGIEIEKYTGFSSAYYDSTVDGSTYALTVRTRVGDETVKFTVELVKNEKGFGIYNLELDA